MKTKYISIKIEPNGKTPPSRMITGISEYHFFSGIVLGMELTRHGKLDCPDQFLPTTVPNIVKGLTQKIQMATIAAYWREKRK